MAAGSAKGMLAIFVFLAAIIFGACGSGLLNANGLVEGAPLTIGAGAATGAIVGLVGQRSLFGILLGAVGGAIGGALFYYGMVDYVYESIVKLIKLPTM